MAVKQFFLLLSIISFIVAMVHVHYYQNLYSPRAVTSCLNSANMHAKTLHAWKVVVCALVIRIRIKCILVFVCASQYSVL